MVKSVENGTSLPPFLVKCYEMVNDESTNELISWSESNDSFIIWDESKFASQLLPKYFKHSNFSSFVRQLNIYVRFSSFPASFAVYLICFVCCASAILVRIRDCYALFRRYVLYLCVFACCQDH